MITDIPSSSDFSEAGTEMLNLAWDNIMSHMEYLSNLDDDGGLKDEYWQSAHQSVSTALSLAQQGIEFLIKGKICEVHPLLLIATSPRDWPGRKDKAFSEFRTIDAQDLVRCHDTVSQTPLPLAFIQVFEALRRKRNTIMHSVSKPLELSGNDVVLAVLEAANALLGLRAWIQIRKSYLDRKEWGSPLETSDIIFTLSKELGSVLEILNRESAIRFLGVDKSSRRYLCPACTDEVAVVYDEPIIFAQLKPNEPTSTTVHCIVCANDFVVKRVACKKKKCKSNVVYEQRRLCLVCNELQ